MVSSCGTTCQVFDSNTCEICSPTFRETECESISESATGSSAVLLHVFYSMSSNMCHILQAIIIAFAHDDYSKRLRLYFGGLYHLSESNDKLHRQCRPCRLHCLRLVTCEFSGSCCNYSVANLFSCRGAISNGDQLIMIMTRYVTPHNLVISIAPFSLASFNKLFIGNYVNFRHILLLLHNKV